MQNAVPVATLKIQFTKTRAAYVSTQGGAMKHATIVVVTAATMFTCMAIAAVAANVHRWVDKDGKVHYSQIPPVTAPADEAKLKIQTPSALSAGEAAGPQAERDAQGVCLTMKCVADDMEADRLERERGYAERIAENERAGRKKTESKQPTIPNPLDEHLQANCRNGLFYGSSSKVNCDDIATLRQQWQSHQQDIRSGQDYLQRHPELREPGFRR